MRQEITASNTSICSSNILGFPKLQDQATYITVPIPIGDPFALPGGVPSGRQGGILSAHAPSASAGGGLAQGGPITYPDYIGTFGVRSRQTNNSKYVKLEADDWVPKVIKKYGVFVVGTGRTTDPRCGRFMPLNGDTAGACPQRPNEHKPLLLPIGCTKRDCPEDYSRWSHKAARRVSNVVNGYLRAKFKEQAESIPGFVPRYFPDHISVHPPRNVIVSLVRKTEKAMREKGILKSDYHAGIIFHQIFLKKYEYALKKVLECLGVWNCVSVYHPIRLNKIWNEDRADVERDTARYRRVLDNENWINGVKFSVHSHIITDGSFLMNSEEFFEKTGWTYHNHREISKIENLVEYLLSHAGAIPGRHSVRYYGDFHNMTVEGIIKKETFVPCPECLKEGTPESEATYIVGKLLGDPQYQRDENGRNKLVSWEWGEIYGKKYVKRARVIPIFRLNHKGVSRCVVEKINGRPETVPYDVWKELPRALKYLPRWIEHYSPEEWNALAVKPKEYV
jgi:hypothetical protein